MKCELCCGCCVSVYHRMRSSTSSFVLSIHSLACLLAPVSVQCASASFLFLFILRIIFISSLDARCAYLFFGWLLFYLLRFFFLSWCEAKTSGCAILHRDSANANVYSHSVWKMYLQSTIWSPSICFGEVATLSSSVWRNMSSEQWLHVLVRRLLFWLFV